LFKIRPVGAELFRADGGLEEFSTRFSQFYKSTEICCGENIYFAWFQASDAK